MGREVYPERSAMKEGVVEGPVPVGALAEYREALVGQQNVKTEF
ncbi:hypothetical protein [Salegentibacter sp.]